MMIFTHKSVKTHMLGNNVKNCPQLLTPGSSTSGQAGPNGQGQQQRQGPGFENYDIPRNLGRQVCSTLIVLFDGWVHRSVSEDELRSEHRKIFTD